MRATAHAAAHSPGAVGIEIAARVRPWADFRGGVTGRLRKAIGPSLHPVYVQGAVDKPKRGARSRMPDCK